MDYFEYAVKKTKLSRYYISDRRVNFRESWHPVLHALHVNMVIQRISVVGSVGFNAPEGGFRRFSLG